MLGHGPEIIPEIGTLAARCNPGRWVAATLD